MYYTETQLEAHADYFEKQSKSVNQAFVIFLLLLVSYWLYKLFN